MLSFHLVVASALLLANAAYAQTTSVTKTAPKEVSAPIGKSGATIAPSATTVYTQPDKGANGPIPGSKAGSRTDTSYGVTITVPLPEKK